MSYLDVPLDCVRKAFAEKGVFPAMALLHKGLWEATETKRELVALLGDLGDRLASEGSTEEAAFCVELRRRIGEREASGIEFEWFMAETLWVTGWAAPSPKRMVDRYLQFMGQAVAEAQARSSLPHRLTLTVRHATRAPVRKETGLERAGRIAMAIGSLGVSEVWRDAK